jgi:predicted MFS family arabinose efflux permease
MFIVLSFLDTFLSLAIGTFILSMCNDSFRPANSTAVAHYSNAGNRTRSYSLNRLAVNLGWSFGGALGGFIASHNYKLLFYVDGCTNIVAAILLLNLLPAIKIKKKADSATESPVIKSPYRDKLYIAFIILTALFGSCFFQIFTMQPVFFKTVWHFDEQFIGLLMAMNGMIIVLTEMILIHKIEGRKPSMYFISLGVLFVGVSYLFYNLFPATVWVAVIAMILITLGEMFTMPFMNTFWYKRTNENNRGAYAALFTIAWSTAQILAPIYGAIMIQHGGYPALWWLLFSICLFTSAGFYAIYKLDRIKQRLNWNV